MGRPSYLLEGDGAHFPLGWAPDGRLIFVDFTESLPEQRTFALDVETLATTRLPQENRLFAMQYSADGALVAEVTFETDRWDVFVARVDRSDRRLVSSAGGAHPMWAPRGDTLYYVRPDELGGDGDPALMAAVIDRTDFSFTERVVSEWPDASRTPKRVHPSTRTARAS